MAAVRNLAQFVGKEMTTDTLHLAARLPDGSRVQVVMPPCSHSGVCFAIRKFSRKMLQLDDLVNWGAISPKAAEWLKIVVKMKKNTLISGGTGSGKTTLLNILGSMIPEGERILIMEDVCELQIYHDHLVSLETRQPIGNPPRGGVSMRDLVMIALRMRPDRVIVGEVRGGEAMDLLQAMSTGHSGSMGTIHANDPMGGLRRMETLASYAGGEIPLTAIRSQVTSSLEVIVQVNRFGDGSRRVTHISEVLPLDLQGNFQSRDIFRFNLKGKGDDGKLIGDLEPTGEESLFLSQIPLYGIDLDPDLFRV
jgi:pilus assembly protein CpaF